MYQLIKKKIRQHPLLSLGGGCLFSWWLYLENYRVECAHYVLKRPHLPAAFDGVTLLHLSDSHNGILRQAEEQRMCQGLAQFSIDYILMTGDLIDRRNPNYQSALKHVEKWLTVAPIYFVSGNHEARCKGGKTFVNNLQKMGVHVLDLQKRTLERNGQHILLMGLPDPYAYGAEQAQGAYIQDALTLAASREDFAILMAHRPEYLPLYNQLQADLVLSGHAHGGQIRLPGIGGLYAPGQGFLPRYTHGAYTLGRTTMVVSRGLGKSVFPQRVLNRPEIGIIELVKC